MLRPELLLSLSIMKVYVLHVGVSFPELEQKHPFFYPIPVDLLPYPPLQGLMYGLSNLNIYVSLYLYFPS